MRLTVLGTGYLGATHAVCMAELGHDVLGMDFDANKIAMLTGGEVPFYEPGLPELLRKNLEAGRLRFTTSYEEVGAFGDLHFTCVGTPQSKGSHAADMTFVRAVMAGLTPHLADRAVVVGKSTVPAGTAASLAADLAVGAPTAELVWNPEFLREGFAVEDTLRPDRLVVGVENPGGHGEQMIRACYAPMTDTGIPLLMTDFATAELVKVAANSFLATKISFINAMAEICEAVGGDVTALSKALSYDTRIGGRFLHAGLGFGGGCLPKDIRAFQARADELGMSRSLRFLDEVDAINIRRRSRAVLLASDLCGGNVAGKKIAVLGAAFKPDSDDIRDSASLDVADQLHRAGATVVVTDPEALGNAQRLYPELKYADTAAEACAGADVTMLLTEWSQFTSLTPADLAPLVAAKNIVDGRNIWAPATWREAGWEYRSLGRP